MAEIEILPDWAARYVQERLAEHMHIVNVLPIDKGQHGGSFLLNTSKGAVLVQKGRLSEVNHWFMPYPGEHVSFACERCHERMELVDPDVPRLVYCSACGQQHYLVVEDGELRIVDGDGGPATCTATLASGKPCKSKAKPGSDFCARHR
jgi:PHP family Zn ribbon phosphoesterase